MKKRGYMSYIIDKCELEKLFCCQENSIIFPKERGFQKDSGFLIDEDISIVKGFICTKENLSIQYIGDVDNLYLLYFLSGEAKFNSKSIKELLLLNKDKSLILYNNEKHSSLSFKKDNNSHILGIKISKVFLDKYLPNFKNNKIEYVNNNPKIIPLVENIYENPLTDKLDKLYIHGKILRLIHLKFLIYSSLDIEQKIMLSAQDIKALKSAKSILQREFKNPPCINKLAKRVCLNEHKLKNGFKSLFGTTPYKFSLHSRLQKAKKLLQSGEHNVNEAAKAVGFPYVQNFTTAFVKKFGTRPIDVLKQNQTYIK